MTLRPHGVARLVRVRLVESAFLEIHDGLEDVTQRLEHRRTEHREVLANSRGRAPVVNAAERRRICLPG